VYKANLDYIQHELQLGAVSDLSMYRPEQNYASQHGNHLAERVLPEEPGRRDTPPDRAADIDPNVRDFPVVLTDAPDLSPAEAIAPDREQTVQKALGLNPSIKIALENLSADEYGLTSARNGLLRNWI